MTPLDFQTKLTQQAEARVAALEEGLREFLGATPGEMNTSPGHKLIVRGLGQCIGDHASPITRDYIGSAAKRIATNLRNHIHATHLLTPRATTEGK